MPNGLPLDPSLGIRHSLSPDLDVVGGAEDVGFKLKDRFGHIFSLIGWRASVRSRVGLTNKVPNLAHSESDYIFKKKKSKNQHAVSLECPKKPALRMALLTSSKLFEDGPRASLVDCACCSHTYAGTRPRLLRNPASARLNSSEWCARAALAWALACFSLAFVVVGESSFALPEW